MKFTAQDVIETITRAVPSFRPHATCDTLKSGQLTDEVRGIAVTFTATRDVLARAIKLGANFIITHEPTYYNDERLAELTGDPVIESKQRFIAENGLTIWRCHDSWHQLKPDGILTGMTRQLGWQKFQHAEHPELFDLPAQTLGDLISHLKKALQVPALRFIGDPSRSITRVAFSCGCPSWDSHRSLINLPGVDVLICGEIREWETCEYVRDAISAGRPIGLIVVGHCNSEEAGMNYLADWLRERLAGVPIQFVPACDPFSYATASAATEG
jgi:putative NIF3 family GTP cyclohydrolase 1 type 2